MKHLTSGMKRQQIEWRRAKVLELSSQGYSEREITERLQPLAVCTVHRDLVYLRQQARENLQHHIHETVPAAWEQCYSQINQVLRKTWEIVDKTADERVRLQALALIDQCNSHKMTMVTNGTIITDAMNYINSKTKELNSSAEKKLSKEQEGESGESESKESEEPDYGEEEELEEGQEKDTGELEEEEKTTNDVF